MMLVKQAAVYVNILNCRLKKHLGEVFKNNGINLTAEQFLVMDTLWNEGALTQQNIAYIIQKDKNSVTQFVDNLEKKGLVVRSVDKEDRRVNNVVVTEKGLLMRDSTKEIAINAMNDILSGVSEEDLNTFIYVLRKATETIQQLGKEEAE